MKLNRLAAAIILCLPLASCMVGEGGDLTTIADQ
jgi:hypothetical protein